MVNGSQKLEKSITERGKIWYKYWDLKRMKFPSILLLLVVFFYGCTSSSSDIEPEEIIAQDPKCLVSTQWGNDFSKPTEFPSSHWMRDPEMYFNSLNAGFFSLD